MKKNLPTLFKKGKNLKYNKFNIYVDNVFLYVHKKGQFLTDLRNGLLNLPSIDHIVDTEISIKVKNQFSTPSTQCMDEFYSFDKCVENSVNVNMQKKCKPLLWYQPYILFNSSRKTREALKLFQSSGDNCLTPCTQVKVDIRLNPVNWLHVLVIPKHTEMTYTPGYVINIPSTIVYSEMQESYTLISFIAEFGGWVGLLLGISLLGSFEYLSSKLLTGDCKKGFLRLIAILKLACMVGVLFVLFKSGQKYINEDSSTDINLETDLPEVSVSMCHVENLYAEDFLNSSYSYIGNLSGFWSNLNKISNIIERIDITYQYGKLATAYDSKSNQSSENMIYSINTPQFETFVETCHTMDLKHWNRIKSIKVKAKKELRVFVHLTGQLLRPGRQGFSFIDTDTVHLWR